MTSHALIYPSYNMKKVSYIFPIYNEEESLTLLYSTVAKTIAPLKSKYEFEILFVNDGSRDSSLQMLWDIAEKDSRVVVVDLSRNFGHQIAVTAGIHEATGDALIIMDSDMQDPPAVSLELIKKWEEGYDVAYAQRRTRKDTFFKKTTADLFYRTLQKLADIDIPRNTGDFRLISRKVADELNKYGEHNRFLRGMVSYVGFKQIGVLFDRDERHAGESKYPLSKMLRLASDGIMGFSSAPLKLISRVGYVISGLSILAIIYAIVIKLFFPSTAVEGWAFTVISIFFVGGVQLTMLGVIGSYLGRIYTEVQGRPLYGIKSIHRNDKE